MLGFFKLRLRNLTYKNIVSKIILAIITVSFFTTAFSDYKFDSADYFNSISFGGYFFSALLLFGLLILLLPENLNGYTIIFVATALFYITNSQDKNIYFALVSSLVIGGLVFYFANSLKFPA